MRKDKRIQSSSERKMGERETIVEGGNGKEDDYELESRCKSKSMLSHQ
jgi:hypothetical protein